MTRKHNGGIVFTKMEREATITYTKPLADRYTLIGLHWGMTERHSDDFDLETIGKVLACGTESRKQIGWAVFDDSTFTGKVGDIIELKQTVIGG